MFLEKARVRWAKSVLGGPVSRWVLNPVISRIAWLLVVAWVCVDWLSNQTLA